MTDFFGGNEYVARVLQQACAPHLSDRGKTVYEITDQQEYERVLSQLRDKEREITRLNEQLAERDKTIASHREDLAAARKLRRQHEKTIKRITLECEVAQAESALARCKSALDFQKTRVHNAEVRLIEAEEALGRIPPVD